MTLKKADKQNTKAVTVIIPCISQENSTHTAAEN